MAKGHAQFAEDAAAEEPATTTINSANGEPANTTTDAEHGDGDGEGSRGDESRGGRRPVDRVRIGMIQGAIWRNENQKGTAYQVSFERMYYDKVADNWKYTKSFGRDELLPLAKVANECHTRILMRQKKERDAEREAEGDGNGEGSGNGDSASESPGNTGDTGNGANRSGSAKSDTENGTNRNGNSKGEQQPPPRQKASRMNSSASNTKRSRSGR